MRGALEKKVAIVTGAGQGIGKAITLRSANGPANCIIDCQGSEADNHRGVYFQNYEYEDTILDGFTIMSMAGIIKEGAHGENKIAYLSIAPSCPRLASGWAGASPALKKFI